MFEMVFEDLQLPLIGLVESSVEPVLFFGLTPDVRVHLVFLDDFLLFGFCEHGPVLGSHLSGR